MRNPVDVHVPGGAVAASPRFHTRTGRAREKYPCPKFGIGGCPAGPANSAMLLHQTQERAK
jgi:hypothetical protein